MRRKSALTPRMPRIGPPRSPAQATPSDEEITLVGGNPRIRTLAPQRADKTQKALTGVPDKARAEKGMSLSLLLKKQPRYLLNSSEDVVIRTYKRTKTKGGMPAISGTSRDLKTKPMRVHKMQVIGLDTDAPISRQKRIKVSCSCEFFMYYSEYALWTWGASNIKHSNGQPAVVRNPGNHPVLCKHLVRALVEIKQQGD